MEERQPARIVVLGLGNPVLTDDAVGLRVAEELERLLAQDPLAGVEVLASTRAGFELLDLLPGYDHAIIIDCLEVPQPQPGRVRYLSLDSFAGSARLNMAHEINLPTAFALAEKLGLKMPRVVEILAVEAADTRTLAEEMTEAVAGAVQPLAQELHGRLKELTAGAVEPDTQEPPRRAFYSFGDD
jgi:hydrogenase maturation protease